MLERTFKSASAACLLAVASFWACALASAEDYRLQTGDVVGFSISNYPDMQKRATVDENGSIMLPVLGRLAVRDLTVSELRQRVVDGLAQKSIPRPLNDGSENWVIFHADQITVDIEEYRPVFIDGDVATPGAQTFRPGMTIRQMIAASGGFEIGRVRIENPILTSAELRGRYDVLRVKAEESRVKVARLQAQLDNAPAISLPESDDPTLAPFRMQALQLEQSRMEAMAADHGKERKSKQLALEKADKRMDYLQEQQATDRQGAKEDLDELARVKALLGKGLIQIDRVIDAQRAVFLSSTRALETNAEVAQLEREQGELQRSLVKLDDQWRIDLMAELQEEAGTLAQTQAEMDGVATQIFYVQGLRTDLVQSAGRKPVITLSRIDAGKSAQVAADEDTPLAPGDTVTVSLRSEYLPSNLYSDPAKERVSDAGTAKGIN